MFMAGYTGVTIGIKCLRSDGLFCQWLAAPLRERYPRVPDLVTKVEIDDGREKDRAGPLPRAVRLKKSRHQASSICLWGKQEDLYGEEKK